MTVADYDSEITRIAEDTVAAATASAARLNIPSGAFLTTLLTHLRESSGDGRAVHWSARLRLYDSSDNYREPVADTDENLDPTKPGATLFSSLPSILPALAQFVFAFHGNPGGGLGSADFKRKLNTLRNQLSVRGDGSGIMRLPYLVADIARGGSPWERHMIARVDVLRADKLEPTGLRPGLQLMADRAAAIGANKSGAE
jgi:hypothetical protein